VVSPHDKRYQVLLKRLRDARREAGLSQIDVAKRMGLIQPLISRIESGERKIDPIEFGELCRLYKKGARYFLPDLPV
jgi:transcriptional regulator with XRE-family HTH domain